MIEELMKMIGSLINIFELIIYSYFNSYFRWHDIKSE